MNKYIKYLLIGVTLAIISIGTAFQVISMARDVSCNGSIGHQSAVYNIEHGCVEE